MQRLNPELPEAAFLTAADELTRDRSRMLPAEANREIHKLLVEGAKVKVPGEDGAPVDETVRLIDWRAPATNDFLLASQFWVSSELYTKRADLVAFVNGIPLVFIELKAHAPATSGTPTTTTCGTIETTIPQLFWPNAFIILSNGCESRDRQHARPTGSISPSGSGSTTRAKRASSRWRR